MSRPTLVDSGAADARDIRCHCGSLVARMIDGKVEIKCRRCQRVGRIDVTRPGAEGELVEVQWLSDGMRARSK
jgi:phage FluMu protein Com